MVLGLNLMKLLRSIILYNLYNSGLFTDLMRSIMESGSVIMSVATDISNTNDFAQYSKGVFDDCRHSA